MILRTTLLSSLFLFTACNSAPPAPEKTGGPLMVEKSDKPADKIADEAKAEAEKKAEEKKNKAKELKLKLRELDYAKVEMQTGDIDRQTRMLSVNNSLDKQRFELKKAQKELELWKTVVRPKELEERRISHAHSVNYAEQAKDEFAELEAMYQAEEFAKSTKELVLKRGRKSMELSQRSLAVSIVEMKLVEEQTLPDKEVDLTRKVADAELEVKKAEMELGKVQIELELGLRRAKDKLADLEQDIAELQAKIAKEKP